MSKLKQIAMISATSVALFGPQIARAWGGLGHETIGHLTEKIIAGDEDLKGRIRGVVGLEPLSLSSTWPDDVRDDSRFEAFAPYHFVTFFQDPKKRLEKDAIAIIEGYPQIIADTAQPREARMIAFRYLVHMVQDVHQPLHVGNEFDRGGNTCQVEWRPTESGPAPATSVCTFPSPRGTTGRQACTNLHSVWDTKVVEHLMAGYRSQASRPDAFFGSLELAEALWKKHEAELKAPARLELRSWIEESADLSWTQTYPDALPADQRPYCRRDFVGAAPILDKAYADRAAQIAEQQILRAAQRLAAFLKRIFAPAPLSAVSEAEILKLLSVTNGPQASGQTRSEP